MPREPASSRVPQSSQSLSNGDAVGRTHQYRVGKRESNLKPRIKHISRNTILSTWKNLDEEAQSRVQDVLRSIGIPVLARHSPQQKKIAQGVIGSLTCTLSKRLPRMVFPPKTRKEQFDYDELAKSNRDLQCRLAASFDSTALLNAEVQKQKAALEVELQGSEELEASS